jgi:hypothetical protein
MVRGTEISPEHSKFFEESEGVWTSRDHKLQKRVERLQRKKQLREKFAYANTANRNDGGADLSIPLDNDVVLLASRSQCAARLELGRLCASAARRQRAAARSRR